MDWCRQIRNQYAHCQWYWTAHEGLCFVDLEAVAKQVTPITELTKILPSSPRTNFRSTFSSCSSSGISSSTNSAPLTISGGNIGFDVTSYWARHMLRQSFKDVQLALSRHCTIEIEIADFRTAFASARPRSTAAPPRYAPGRPRRPTPRWPQIAQPIAGALK
jgi:hypothetical protein